MRWYRPTKSTPSVSSLLNAEYLCATAAELHMHKQAVASTPQRETVDLALNACNAAMSGRLITAMPSGVLMAMHKPSGSFMTMWVCMRAELCDLVLGIFFGHRASCKSDFSKLTDD